MCGSPITPLKGLALGALTDAGHGIGFPIPLHPPFWFHVVCVFRIRLQYTGIQPGRIMLATQVEDLAPSVIRRFTEDGQRTRCYTSGRRLLL